MSPLNIYTSVLITCASAVFASGIVPGSAMEECGQSYKICNGSCDQPIEATNNVGVCKIRCDVGLIACDKQPVSSFVHSEKYSNPHLLPTGTSPFDCIVDRSHAR
jgi:hypothetical protein